MYFGVAMAGKRHLWRQRFPDGQPERITSGQEQEDGVAVAPDGRSLITSILTQQSSVWFHDSTGDHAVSTEGYAASPDEHGPPLSFSSDGKRLYYLMRRDSPASPTELWRASLDSGRSEAVVSGFSIRAYDISSDEKEVVFSTQPAGQASQLWLASLDRSVPPHRIAATGEDVPHFGPNGQVLFRLTDGKTVYLAQMGRDGTARTKVVPFPIINIWGISPDRRFVILFARAPESKIPNAVDTMAIPIAGGPPRRICHACETTWSPNGKYFYVGIAPPSRTDPTGRMVAIPVPAGETLPSLPAAGIRTEAEALAIPGARTIEQGGIAAGSDPSTYAYVKSAMHANLFRIPLR
jgi:Tol biopolymer transport system component